MMRNVAIGAVLGFGLIVLLLSIFNNEAPPPAPPPPPTVVAAPPAADAGAAAATLTPLNAAPVVVTPFAVPLADRRAMMREMLRNRRGMLDAAADAGAQPPGP